MFLISFVVLGTKRGKNLKLLLYYYTNTVSV